MGYHTGGGGWGGRGPGLGRRPVVRLGAIGEAWGLYKARWTTWAAAGVVVLLGNMVLGSAVHAVFGHRLPLARGPRLALRGPSGIADLVVAAVLNGFLLGGMFRMACTQARGGRIAVADLFGVTDVFAQLALGLAVFSLCCGLLAPFGLVPALVLAGVWMFVVPLIVDARLPAFDAIRGSWHALKSEWLSASLFHFIAYALAGAGSCCCCTGPALTWPLYCLSIAVLYRDAFPTPPASFDMKPGGHDPDF